MKADKYDRQVRIWGTKGQKKLSHAKVAIIGCSGASIEAAKNLILPGIGRVDILDDQKVQIEDLSSSFFYTQSSVGKLRGQQASKNLLEMNTDVEGEFKNISIHDILSDVKTHLTGYDLVICSNLTSQQSAKLSQQCWSLSIPVIFATSVGFFFHVRSQKQQHIVQNENTTGRKYYLRLHDPFEGLKEYVKEKELLKVIAGLKENQENSQAKKELQKLFSKVTYPVFLVEAYAQLKQQLNRAPESAQVKQLLTEWRNLVSEDLDIRNGVSQALTRTFDLYQSYDNFLLDLEIFNDMNVANATINSAFVYIFLKAVKQYIARYNNLPQVVRLPDISTSTKDYLELKNVYKLENEKCKLVVRKIVEELFPGYVIDEELLGEYVNNIDALKIVKMRAYYEELKEPDVATACLEYLGDVKSLFVAMRTYAAFRQQHQRVPTPADNGTCLQISQKLSSQWNLTDINSKFIKQTCRYEGKSLISYDSMAGAIIGQQAVKLLTNCFTPMNSGYLFDGLNCKGYTVAL